jgi:hypothetical protein
MLVEDITAFIEPLEVLKDRKQTVKHRHRVAQATFEMLEAQRDVGLAAEALGQMERELARGVESVSTGRGLVRRRGARSLEREIETVRRHLAAKRDELTAKQKRLNRVEQVARERDAARRSATMFRLHSGVHHVDCSAARLERLSAAQLELPVQVARRNGQGWWWYLDRFWWGDERLTAIEVEKLVLQSDLHRKQKSDAFAQARVMLLGEARVPLPEEHLADPVRLAVWRRDRGRCVDCGSGKSVVFDHIVPISQGGSNTDVNVELRCQACCVRLARNEMRSKVSRARVEALPLYRDERLSA